MNNNYYCYYVVVGKFEHFVLKPITRRKIGWDSRRGFSNPVRIYKIYYKSGMIIIVNTTNQCENTFILNN